MRKLLSNLTLRQRLTIAGAAVLVTAGMFAFVQWRRTADYRPLFTGMAAEDAAAVVQKLKESGVSYKLADNGSTVQVPSAKLAEWRLGMAAAGLPKSGRIGFELFDKTNFGATEFTEQINYRRALEGELERSVMSLAAVEQARVHLTFPKDSVFVEARQPAKGSVLVKLRPGTKLEQPNVAAICQLVASAVEGLAPEAVSVLDMRGNLLSRPRRHSPDLAAASEDVLEFRQKVEADLLAKINSTLEPLLGAERFRAGVSVECDFTSGEQSEETFDPSRTVMTSVQKTEDTSGAASAASAGVPGTASNLPRPAAKPAGASGGLTRRTENITFQTSRTERHIRLPQGSIKRLSIAVLVDQGVQWEGQRRVLVPQSAERLKSIRDLVTAATGFVAERGDQIVVETQPFESTLNAEPPAAAPGAPAARPRPRPWNEKLMADWKLLAGPAAAVLLLLGMLVRLLRRPKSSRPETAAAPPALPASQHRPLAAPAQIPANAQDLDAQLTERENQKQQLEQEALNMLKLPPLVTRKTEVLSKHLRESIKKDPAVPAQVLLSWLREGES